MFGIFSSLGDMGKVNYLIVSMYVSVKIIWKFSIGISMFSFHELWSLQKTLLVSYGD